MLKYLKCQKQSTKYSKKIDQVITSKQLKLREKCPNTELFLFRIFLYSVPIPENMDQK